MQSDNSHYFSIAELLRLQLPGYPATRQGWDTLVKRDKWESRETKGLGGPGGIRREYTPPPEVMALIESRRRGEIGEGDERGGYITDEKSGRKKYFSEESQPSSNRGRNSECLRKAPLEAPNAPDGFVLVPRYDVSGSMGGGAAIHSEQIVDHLAFRADWVRTELGTSPRHLVLISAIGDSMEPTLRAGDLLLIDRSVESVRQDAIYAIAHDGELRIKRIQHLFDGSLVIKSDNPSYQREDLNPDQAARLRIVGRVVWSGRRM